MQSRPALIGAPNAATIVAILRKLGHDGEVQRLDDGTHYVRARANQRKWGVALPQRQGATPAALQFYCWFDPAGRPVAEQANNWNADHLLVKAGMNENGQLELAWDIPLPGPVTAAFLEFAVARFAAAVDEL